MVRTNNQTYCLITISLLLTSTLFGQSLSSTVHNLSVSGSGSIKATSETELCIFCHTPHNSSPRAPLWNKDDPGVSYTLYNSSTAEATIGQPDGASILCLSCHDGTIALGSVLSRTSDISMVSSITTMPSGKANLSTDLSDDHPISFVYNSALATSDGQLYDPAALPPKIALENQKVQCISCHDPHNNDYNKFLVEDDKNSLLCTSCHNTTNWDVSSHRNSMATWNSLGSDPWPNSNYTTVSDNACENCHTPHNAGGTNRLMNYSNEEQNCLDCHNGNVATKDVYTEIMLKPYRHGVNTYSNIHDPTESSPLTKHVECQDCHNPHQANDVASSAPLASGYIQGVKGINTDGNEISLIQNQYELCYRCHSENAVTGSPTSREIEQNNVRLEYDPSNLSTHPIENGIRPNNSAIVTLIAPYDQTSVIYCTDCHSSDGVDTPKGPHGSNYPQILKYNYERVSFDNSYTAYEVCYRCHAQAEVITLHRMIKQNHYQRASCNVCHDPHGVTDAPYLLNWDINYVTPNSNGDLSYTDLGPGHGVCNLACHMTPRAAQHINSTY